MQEHGTGLGLAIVRDLVTRCGGRIDSVENQGTTVTVMLPLARAAAAELGSERPGANADPGLPLTRPADHGRRTDE